jgi:hypothetical protein
VSTSDGTTPAGGSTEITVIADSTGLKAGVHEANLCVSSNDPDRPLAGIPVKLTVTGKTCDRTITGDHLGILRVDSGLTCLAYGSSVTGLIRVAPGAALHADGAFVGAAIQATGAAGVEIADSTVIGAMLFSSGTGVLSLTGNHVTGLVSLTGNNTGTTPILVSANTIVGALACTGNQPPPGNGGAPNKVSGLSSGQCRGL